MKRTHHSAAAGFTLIEAVLSIGLLAFALAVILTGLGTAARYAANDARRAVAVELLHRCFRDLEMVGKSGVGRSPTLGLAPLAWGGSPAAVQLWFDADGAQVASRSEAFFRCDLLANREAEAPLGHLHGRVVWPVRKSGARADGQVELFTSWTLP